MLKISTSSMLIHGADLRTPARILCHDLDKTMPMVMRYTHLLDEYKKKAIHYWTALAFTKIRRQGSGNRFRIHRGKIQVKLHARFELPMQGWIVYRQGMIGNRHENRTPQN